MVADRRVLLLLALAGWSHAFSVGGGGGGGLQHRRLLQKQKQQQQQHGSKPASASASALQSAVSSSDLQGLSGTWDREAWIRGFETARTEECYEVEEVEGTIPKDLSGTLFRNGHAKFDVDGLKIAHPFDGDGMISAVTFKEGRAVFRNRFVRTKGYEAELRAKKILYRGTFGTQKPGGFFFNMFDVRRKNVANTNVVYWAGKLLALWEGGLPHTMDPVTLATYKESRLYRVLKPGQNLCAHPRYDPATNRYVFFSAEPDPPRGTTTLITYEFDDQFRPVAERKETLPGFALLHDFVITKDWYVFFKAPLSIQPLKWLLGLAGVASCINFEEGQPAVAHLIPRNDPAASQPRVDIEVDPHFNFHFANAFQDDASGQVVVDIIKVPKLYLTDTKGRTGNPIWETVNYETEVPLSNLWRYTLDPKARTYASSPLFPTYCDFPSIPVAKTGQRYRYTYLAVGRDATYPTPVGVVGKVDVEAGALADSWQAAPHEFISESVVVPKAGAVEEDDVYLMTMVFDGQTARSHLLIFDGKALGKGPVARLQLKSNVPLSLHGSWAPGACVELEGGDIVRKFKVYSGLSKFKEIDSAMQSIF